MTVVIIKVFLMSGLTNWLMVVRINKVRFFQEFLQIALPELLLLRCFINFYKFSHNIFCFMVGYFSFMDRKQNMYRPVVKYSKSTLIKLNKTSIKPYGFIIFYFSLLESLEAGTFVKMFPSMS